MHKYPALFMLLLLTACANLPEFDTSKVNQQLTPETAKKTPATAKGQTVLWGGTILSSKNLKTSTRLELLAYPVDSDGWPNRNAKPIGRFLLDHTGYLETADYAEGRLLTVVGPIAGVEKGKLGETEYIYPVVQAQQKHLWPKSGQKSGTRVHFGIGVIFH